ncbi:hypothetical protein CsSME_00042385 [Camellia sinensis var. sinensis]
MGTSFNTVAIDEATNSQIIKFSNNCKGKIHRDSNPGYLPHVDQRLNSGNHSLSIDFEDISECREINLKMPSALVVHIAHSNSNPGFPSCADKAVLGWIPLFEAFHYFLDIFIVFLLTLLEGLALRSGVPKICHEVQCEGDREDNKDNQNPSELDKIVHPNLLPLGA